MKSIEEPDLDLILKTTDLDLILMTTPYALEDKTLKEKLFWVNIQVKRVWFELSLTQGA